MRPPASCRGRAPAGQRRVYGSTGGQPSGKALGTAGPDQGYALKLVRRFDDRLQLGGVHHGDAVAGCVALAMKRSALFGRAPVIHDLTVAFTIYGFLDASPEAELADTRRKLFAEIDSHHHYFERRQVVDRVDEEWLRQSHTAVADQYQSDWRVFFVD